MITPSRKSPLIPGAVRFVFVWLGRLIGYLYLSRVPLAGLLLLWGLPAAATGALRTLVIGAYDLNSFWEAFFVGLALCAMVASVFITARIVWDLAGKRYDFHIENFATSIRRTWTLLLLLALAFNVVTVMRVSSIGVWPSVLSGLLTGIALGWVAGRVLSVAQRRLLDRRVRTHARMVHIMTMLGLHNEPGYVSRGADGEGCSGPCPAGGRHGGGRIADAGRSDPR